MTVEIELQYDVVVIIGNSCAALLELPGRHQGGQAPLLVRGPVTR